MLRLQRYLLGELLASFALLALIITGIFVVGFLLQSLNRYPEASVSALLSAAPLVVAVALPITLPMSFLTACLLGYGRFSDDNEFIAFQMGGISPWHAAAPAVCAATLLSVGMIELGCEVTPTLKAESKSIFRGEIREQLERMRTSTATSFKFRDMEMSWASRDGDLYRDVFITFTSGGSSSAGGQNKPRTTNRAVAARATVRLTDESPLQLVVTLGDAKMTVDSGGGESTQFRARSIPVYIPVEQDSRPETKSKDEMRSSELFYRVQRLAPTLTVGAKLDADQKDRWELFRKYQGEYWRRIALGLSPLVFALLGVPIGLLVRRGSRAQALVFALFIALPVYYPLLLWGDNLAAMGKLPAALALNLANIVLASVGLGLTYRLVTR